MIAVEKQYTDSEIISGLRRNDEVITFYFYQTTTKLITKFVRNNSGSYQDSKDICHDAILVFLNTIRDDNFTIKYSVTTYIYTISRNIWFNQLKKRNHIDLHINDLDGFEDTTIDVEIDTSWVRIQKNKLFWKHFETLKDDCKQILHLSFKNHSDDHIAMILGINDKFKIIKRKSRCKHYLLQSVRTDPSFNDLFSYE